MLNEVMQSLYAGGGLPVMVLGIIAIALGALESFLGYRIFKVQVAIVTFLAGLAISMQLLSLYIDTRWLVILLSVILALLLSWVSMSVYKLGVFLLVTALMYLVLSTVISNIWICLALAVVVGVCGILLTKHVVIIATGLVGGSLIAQGVALLIWGASEGGPLWLHIAITLAIGIAGIIVQYRTTKNLE